MESQYVDDRQRIDVFSELREARGCHRCAPGSHSDGRNTRGTFIAPGFEESHVRANSEGRQIAIFAAKVGTATTPDIVRC